ncbi:MAG: ATP-binding cassette domain-containing protein [Desulfobacteraceae bacterium]|nr:ATP-binding cassette domain-containing protein [Desulfobacteraceae bacterium]
MIEAKELTKSFGQTKAVRNVSFNVETGDILGFLGPNGAGKSTTMRMLTGYIAPDSGDAFIDSKSVTENPIEVKSQIGYLSEISPLYSEMTVTEFLNFCCEIRGFSGRKKISMTEKAIEKCFLSQAKHQQINTLSKGYRQRVSFAQSIIHDPKYLILDEPTDGLDPNQKQEVREMIKSMSREKAIILSTHILDEAAAICNRAIIISNGEIIADDTPRGLLEKDPDFGSYDIETDFIKDINHFKSSLNKIQIIDKIEIKKNSEKNDNSWIKIFFSKTSSFSTSEIILELEKIFSNSSLKLKSISRDKGDLTKVFRILTSN